MRRPVVALPCCGESVQDPDLEASVPTEHAAESGVLLGPLRACPNSPEERTAVSGMNRTLLQNCDRKIAAVDSPPTLQPSPPDDCVDGQSGTPGSGCEVAREGPRTGEMPNDRNSAMVESASNGESATGTRDRIPHRARATGGGRVRKRVRLGEPLRHRSRFARIRVNAARTTSTHPHVGRCTWTVLELAVADILVGDLPRSAGEPRAADCPRSRVRARTRRPVARRDLLPIPARSMRRFQATCISSENLLTTASRREPSTATRPISRVADAPRCPRDAPERVFRRDADGPRRPAGEQLSSRCCTNRGRARSGPSERPLRWLRRRTRDDSRE